jgi:hypothetical protein
MAEDTQVNNGDWVLLANRITAGAISVAFGGFAIASGLQHCPEFLTIGFFVLACIFSAAVLTIGEGDEDE